MCNSCHCNHGTEGVVVNCCCGGGGGTAVTPPAGGTTTQPPAGTTTPPSGGTTTPSPTTPCSRALVRIDSIHVIKAEDFVFWGEPGANAEWRLTVTVNGQSRTWSNDYVKDGSTFTLGYDFMIDLTNANTTISVKSSGFEEDSSSANDPLPPAEQTHGSADNWGIGATRQLSGSNNDFHYTLSYTVTCLQQTRLSVISRQDAIATVEQRIASMGVKTKMRGDQLLTTFINKVSNRGLQLKAIETDLLVWEGAQSIGQLALDVFPSTPERKASAD